MIVAIEEEDGLIRERQKTFFKSDSSFSSGGGIVSGPSSVVSQEIVGLEMDQILPG